MTDARTPGVVVDTMVISWLFDDRPSTLADHYRQLIGSQPVVLAVQTVMELRFGALQAGWSELRRRRLERRIAEFAVVQPDDGIFENVPGLVLITNTRRGDQRLRRTARAVPGVLPASRKAIRLRESALGRRRRLRPAGSASGAESPGRAARLVAWTERS